jgi:hypothetical protein
MWAELFPLMYAFGRSAIPGKFQTGVEEPIDKAQDPRALVSIWKWQLVVLREIC